MKIIVLALMLTGQVSSSPSEVFKTEVEKLNGCLTSRMEFCMLISMKTPQLRKKRLNQFIHQLWMERYPNKLLKEIEQKAEESGFYAENN